MLYKGLVGRMRDCNKMRFRKLVNNEKQMLKMAKDNMTCKQKKFEELEEYSKGKIEQISTLIDCITKLFTRSISTALHVAFVSRVIQLNKLKIIEKYSELLNFKV